VRSLDAGDPRRVGDFTILARIATGGMATVYFGRSKTGRPAAVKVVHADMAGDPDHRERFRREVAITRRVGGAHTPAVLDADPDAEHPWLAAEFTASASLRDVVRRHGPVPADAVWPLVAALAETLGALHAAGVVHLDVKPSNVLLTLDGPRIIDYGIAATGVVDLAGTPVGSPGFAAPEQVVGGEVGPAADVHALAATLAWAATGTTDPDQVADPRLRTLLRSCLDPDPAARPSPRELVTAAARDDRPLPPGAARMIARSAAEAENPPLAPTGPPRRRALALAALGAVGLAAGAFWWARPKPAPREQALTTPVSTTTTSPAAPTSRTLEIHLFGRTTVTTLSVTVNGVTETVPAPTLPHTRTAEVPLGLQSTTWSVDGHHTTGQLSCVVSVDGSRRSSSGSSATGAGHDFHYEGTA
jgi:Protein kinase domain